MKTHAARGSSAPPCGASHPRASKRNLEDDGAFKRQVAQRLQLCADVGDAFEAVQSAMEHHLINYKETQATVAALERLQAATELTARFETLCASELDGLEDQRLPGLHHRLDKILSKFLSKKTPEQRLEKVCRRFPRLVMKAEKVVADQRQEIAEQAELPGPHQWVPAVLWRLYDDVAAAAGKDTKMKPLKAAMHEVMKTLREVDPFFDLQVLYQPPPPHLKGKWEVVASENLTAICASMTPFFRDLKRRSFALKNKRDSYVRIHDGWNQLRVTMTYVRRTARHFHFLILHLYAVAMGCESPYTHAGSISEKAASGFDRVDVELRSILRIHHSTENSADNLIKETYEWTPELLIFLDEWRRHSDHQNALFGFSRERQVRDFLPLFNCDDSKEYNRQRPKHDVLADIAGHLQDVEYAWRASGLGTAKFELMRIKDVGKLEIKIKRSLGTVVGLVYKMMLARWLDRRRRPILWWTSLELRESLDSAQSTTEVECVIDARDQQTEDSHSEFVGGNENSTQATDNAEDKALGNTTVDAEEGLNPDELKEPQEKTSQLPTTSGFRSPTKGTLPVRPVTTSIKPSVRQETQTDARVPSAALDQVAPQQLVRDQPIWLREIYAWTDEEIKSFNHETERIEDVRAAMLKLCDRLDISKVPLETENKAEARPEFGESIRDDWRVTCLVGHVHALSSTAVAFAEEVALHDAASALVKRPSLRIEEEKPVVDSDGGDKPVSPSDEVGVAEDELLELVCAARKNVAHMLSTYDGKDSPECREYVQSVGCASLRLLRLISYGSGCKQE